MNFTKKTYQHINKFIKKITIFDWVSLFIILASLIFASSFIFKTENWISVKIHIEPEQWWFVNDNPPYWLADTVKIGATQYDNFGRKIAEVTDAQIYEAGGGTKQISLTLNIKTNYDKKTKTHQFNHQPIDVGKPLNLNIGGIGLQGLIIFVEGVSSSETEVIKIVETKSSLIHPWVAQEISVGDQMKDDSGNLLAEILSKRVELADMIVTTDKGNVLVRKNPLERDVYLTLKLVVQESNGLFYFQQRQLIKVGNFIWIKLPTVDINEASIIKIID